MDPMLMLLYLLIHGKEHFLFINKLWKKEVYLKNKIVVIKEGKHIKVLLNF